MFFLGLDNVLGYSYRLFLAMDDISTTIITTTVLYLYQVLYWVPAVLVPRVSGTTISSQI
jgi:hypothetical protein